MTLNEESIIETMKIQYIQPQIEILKVLGKEVVMQPSLHDGSIGTGGSAGNGGELDSKSREDYFEEKEITYGNIW